MDCCQAAGTEELMDPKVAAKDLKRYLRKGPDKTTRILLEALKREGVEGLTLLDIGGGVGVIQHELLRSGVSGATSVDISSAYLEAAKEEARRQGHLERLSQHYGDFVELAGEIAKADIVTLDRVSCCYDEMGKLVSNSAERATELYGVVFPRDRWLVRAMLWLENLSHRVRRNQFRAFAHATASVDAVIRKAGLDRTFSHESLLRQVHVYRRL